MTHVTSQTTNIQGDKYSLPDAIGAVIKPQGPVSQTFNLIVSAMHKKIDPRAGAFGHAEINALAADLAQVAWKLPTLCRAYCASVRQLVLAELAEFAQDDMGAVLADMLADLLSRTGGKQRPLLEFLGRLAKSLEAQLITHVLTERVNSTAIAFGLNDDELNDLWTQVVSQPPRYGATRPVLLLVLEPSVEPKNPKFSLRAVLMTEQYRRTFFVDDTARSPKEVATTIGRLLRLIDASGEFNQERPLVAFCLPRQLWGRDVDQWKIDLGAGFLIEIGLVYQVVLCSQERVAADAEQVNLTVWKERWEKIGERPPRMIWLTSPEEYSDKKVLYLHLSQDNIVCLALAVPPPRLLARRADPFGAALLAGTPIMLWVRSNDYTQQQIQQGLNTLLQQGLDSLPAQLMHQREQAARAGDPSIWPHVVLLWDHPTFRPARLRLRRPDDRTAHLAR
jgi:hypothetical protein